MTAIGVMNASVVGVDFLCHGKEFVLGTVNKN